MTYEERRRPAGPSTVTISITGIIAIAGLIASGIATYNALQNDIATLKRDVMYQERTNERFSEEIKAARLEQRESLHKLNEKIDRLIERWPDGGRK